jgi:hypothetical protein
VPYRNFASFDQYPKLVLKPWQLWSVLASLPENCFSLPPGKRSLAILPKEEFNRLTLPKLLGTWILHCVEVKTEMTRPCDPKLVKGCVAAHPSVVNDGASAVFDR